MINDFFCMYWFSGTVWRNLSRLGPETSLSRDSDYEQELQELPIQDLMVRIWRVLFHGSV